MFGTVYKIINKINGKLYIGQTTQTMQRRWLEHCRKNSNCRVLSRAIKKYGRENFEIKIIAHCISLKEMNYREQYYIKLFNTLTPYGYNLNGGGNLKLHHEETKKKMSESHKGSKNYLFGKTISEEVRKKISNAKKGNCSGDRNPMFGKKHSTESLVKNKEKHQIKILCAENGKIYDSGKIAAEELKISRGDISSVLTGHRKSVGGYHFSYYKL